MERDKILEEIIGICDLIVKGISQERVLKEFYNSAREDPTVSEDVVSVLAKWNLIYVRAFGYELSQREICTMMTDLDNLQKVKKPILDYVNNGYKKPFITNTENNLFISSK
jgi:hypothetical protein